MADMKSTHDTVSAEMQNPSSDGAKPLAPAFSTAQPFTQKAPSLETMPVEILRQIHHASFEPNLIHTCRSFYQNLPDYEAYARSLALLALSPRRHPWTRTPIAAIDLPLPELKRCVDLDQLRLAVCRSSWLTPAMLATTHLTILEHFAYATIQTPVVMLRSFLGDNFDQTMSWLWANYCHINQKLPLRLRPRSCPENPLDGVKMEIYGFWGRTIGNIFPHYTSAVDAPEWFCIFEMDVIPDCLLANPTDATTNTIIWLMQHFEQPQQHLSCSPELMQQAILKTIRHPQTPQDAATIVGPDQAFYNLIELNELCRPPAPLTAEMLALAVHQDEPDMVRHLLLSFPWNPNQRNSVLKISGNNLLRLELGLRPRQHACYNELINAFRDNFDGDDIGQDVALRHGFADVRTLKATRRALHDMFCPQNAAARAAAGYTGPVIDDGEESDSSGSSTTTHVR